MLSGWVISVFNANAFLHRPLLMVLTGSRLSPASLLRALLASSNEAGVSGSCCGKKVNSNWALAANPGHLGVIRHR